MPNSNSNNPTTLRPFEVTIPSADGTTVVERIPLMVPMAWEPLVNEWVITDEAERMIEETKARHMGLILPDELIALRERLGLTQTQLCELLKIGEKTWSRWEGGRHRPSQSMNLLLRALQTGVIAPYALRQLGQPNVDWTTALAAKTKTETTFPLSLVLPLEPADSYGNYEDDPLAA